MKTELPTLAGQRETCHEEKERADKNLEFFFWFSIAVLTYLFTGFISTAVRLV